MSILYLSYFSETNHRLTVYSILSCLRISGHNVRIRLITDSPGEFKDLESVVEIEEISRTVFETWCNETTWVHMGDTLPYHWMPKLHVFERQESSFLYLDSDTIILRPLEELLSRLDRENSVLYEVERRLQQHPWFPYLVVGWPDTTLDGAAYMWNSGVVGVHTENIGVFREARDLTKRILETEPTALTAEQLSIGMLLETRSTVHAAVNHVFHFYGKKELYLPQVNAALNRYRPRELVDLCLGDPEESARALGLP